MSNREYWRRGSERKKKVVRHAGPSVQQTIHFTVVKTQRVREQGYRYLEIHVGAALLPDLNMGCQLLVESLN